MGKKDARRRKEEGEEEGQDGNEIRVDFPLKKKTIRTPNFYCNLITFFAMTGPNGNGR